ncbi:MAG: hypothetical protein MUO54_14660 [Anaerolineales bacterium]|nr:hypothetical protein [Anaerolineales bacterium]
MNNRLQAAIQLIQEGNKEQARQLILAEVKENSSNLTAWIWALEVAANDKEKRTIINRILSIDPTHQGAIRYLKKLDQTQESTFEEALTAIEDKLPSPRPKDQPSRIGGLFRLVFQWIASLPLSCGVFFLIIVIAVSGYFYFRANTSFFGLVGTDFDNLVISNSYEKIEAEDLYWEVQFEGQGHSKYIGTVRHVSPIRINEFKILTHDILVTTADFSDPDLVDTTVVNHKFIWKSSNSDQPTGSINLIHAVPANKAIYQQLLEIKNWDIVNISGREIYTVKSYDVEETFLGTWVDTGCNTLLIDSVTVLKNPAPNNP